MRKNSTVKRLLVLLHWGEEAFQEADNILSLSRRDAARGILVEEVVKVVDPGMKPSCRGSNLKFLSVSSSGSNKRIVYQWFRS